MTNFKVGDKVQSLYYGIGVVVATHSDNSFRVDGFTESLLRPVYWQETGKQYNPKNEMDVVTNLFIKANNNELEPLLERAKRFE